MDNLLKLQDLDAQISACRQREAEIPKQKNKFDIYRERLKAELEEREKGCTDLELEQRDCESDIEQNRALTDRYQQQLNAVKKNDEYQALLHEIDLVKKQIGIKEERILAIMLELDDFRARLAEDRKRIGAETEDIERQCAEIDEELAEAVKQRHELEAQRQPVVDRVAADLLPRYERLRRKFKTGEVVVPLRDEVCTGCNMHVLPQIVNEVLEGRKIHACQHCGRLLFHPAESDGAVAGAGQAPTEVKA